MVRLFGSVVAALRTQSFITNFCFYHNLFTVATLSAISEGVLIFNRRDCGNYKKLP